MGKAEQSIQHVCGLAELMQVRDWEKRSVEVKLCYKTQRTKARTAVNSQPEKPMQKSKCLSKPAASHMTS